MKEWSNLAKIIARRTYNRNDNGNLENWKDTVERSLAGNIKNHNVSREESEKLKYLALNRKAMCAGRGLWFSGSPAHIKIGGAALNNCWFTIANDWTNFVMAQDLLMLGGGVGLSVEHRFVSKLPKVKKDVVIISKPTKDADFIVPDSREGWNELIFRVLESFFVTGKSFSFSTICVRDYGMPIKGFGGTSSGTKPLIDFVGKVCAILIMREGKFIRPIDASDIICAIGEMVVSGNVRRSAILILGDPWDKDYLKAKRWDLGPIPSYRAMANFSVVCDDVDDLHPLYWKTYEAGEAFGIFNRKNAQTYGRMGERKKDTAIGVNPSLRAKTKILTKSGIYNIEDLEGKTFQVKNLNNDWSDAECWLSGKNKQLWEIELRSGKKYYATAEHQWPVYLNGRYIKLTTDNLIAGDCLPLNKNRKLFDGEIGTYDDGFFIGWLYGDGWLSIRNDTHKRQYGFIVSEEDQKYGIHTKLCDYLTKITGEVYKGTAREGNLEFNVSAELIDNWLQQFGVSFKEDGLPSCIWTCSEVFRHGFIDGIMSSDGSVEQTGGSEKTNNGSLRINWSSAHIKLFEEFSELLGFYGIKLHVSENISKDVQFPNCKKYERSYHQYILRISGRFDIVHFRNTFKLTHLEKDRRLRQFYKNISEILYDNDEIRSVKETNLYEDVWDIRVNDISHCFQLSHCVTGNCAEAMLEDGEPCNLQEIFLPNIDNIDEFKEAAVLMHRWGKRVTNEQYHNLKNDEVVKRNRRIGTGITGCLQAPDLFKADILDEVYKAIQKENIRYSKELDIPESIRTTVVKPSGTLSLLGDCTPGIHPAYSKYYIRRIRFSSNDPLIKTLRDSGHKIEPVFKLDGGIDHNTLVVDFYCKVSDETPCADNGFDTWKQLDILLFTQKYWADQSVSVTVYYKKEEISQIKAWIALNLKNIKTISFLCYNDHGFKQSPLEAISQESYEKLSSNVEDINFDDIQEGALENLECEGAACPIK